MSDPETPSGPLDVPTLEICAQRAITHSLVVDWAFEPDSISPRLLRLEIDAVQYPDNVTGGRLDVRWFVGGDYSIHYNESHTDGDWQCRWDRHPKPTAPRAHFHPPPDADGVDSSPITETHHLGVLFATLEWIDTRRTADNG